MVSPKRQKAVAGEDLGASVAFFQPLDSETCYIITPSIDYRARDVPTFLDGSRVAEFRISTLTGRLTLARQLANWGAIKFGLTRGWGWSDVNIGTPAPSDDDFSIGNYFTRINYDTFDNLNFPNNGTKAFAEFLRSLHDLGGDQVFSAVSAAATFTRTFAKNTILINGATGITSSGTAPTENLFELGGLFNLSVYQSGALTGQDFAAGRLIGYRNIGAQPGSFGVLVYLGASLEAGNIWDGTDDMSFDDLILAGSVFIGLDTPIGPVYLSFGHAEGGRDSAYLFLGQTF